MGNEVGGMKMVRQWVIGWVTALVAWSRGEKADDSWLEVNEGAKVGKCDRIVETKK